MVSHTREGTEMLRNENDSQKSSFTEPESFHPMILRNQNGFCVYLPEWKISGVGESLEDAYLQFEQKIKAAKADAAEFGLAALTSEPYPVLTKAAVLQDLMLFFVKVASSSFIVILLVVLLLPNIAAAFRHNIKEMFPKEIIPAELKDPRYWAVQFPEQMNARLDRLKPEEEAQMRNEWNKLLGRTAPIISPLTCQPQVKARPARP